MNALFGNLTHFQALLFFALVVSVTFAFLSKRDIAEAGSPNPAKIRAVLTGDTKWRVDIVSSSFRIA